MGGPFHVKKDFGHWSIPKGEYEENEDPKEVAKREFGEELGKEVPEGEWQELGIVEYKNKKTVTAWAIEGDLDVANITSNDFEMEWPPRSGKMQKFPEIDRADWFNLPTAAKKLIPAQAEFLYRLADKLGVDFDTSVISEDEKPKQNSLF